MIARWRLQVLTEVGAGTLMRESRNGSGLDRLRKALNGNH